MSYHFIGIGGVGMSALARILLEQNCSVKGSDKSTSQTINDLEEAGAKIYTTHDASHIQPEDTVVYSSGIFQENAEYQAALKQNKPLYHRSELLDQLLRQKKALLVAGAHGKTTITTLLSYFLQEGGLDPSYVVGGFSPSLQSNGHSGQGPYFVAEADESDGSFIRSLSHGAILANIDIDHIDYWKTESRLLQAYRQFIEQVSCKELLIWYGDDPQLRQMAPSKESVGYGEHNLYRIQDATDGTYSVEGPGLSLSSITSPLVGVHNRINAALGMVLAHKLGVSEECLVDSLRRFSHVKRRMERIGTWKANIALYDDYAHHPCEIAATYKAFKERYPDRRVWVLLQPHRYSRVQALLSDFQRVCAQIPHLMITDIFSAGESPLPNTQIDVKRYVARDDLSKALEENVQEDDIVVTMGAGDISRFLRGLGYP